MAVVNNSLKLHDQMTPVLRSIMKALNSTLDAMANVDKAGGKGFRNMAQAVEQANRAVNGFTDSLKQNSDQGKNAMDGLIDKAKQLAAAYLSIQGVKMLVNLSDQVASLDAALNIINTGQRATLNLQEKIRQSALATGSNYMDVAANVKNLAMMAGNAFSSNDEILYFSEQLNKQFAIAGVNGQQAASVMYNLTQALSSGVLRGNDFNILASNMGNFIDGIAKTMGVSRSEMKKMAEEGKITAAMVKKAMYDMADETDERFKNMPMQWGNIWNNMTTQMLAAAQPLLSRISEIFNSAKFQNFIAGVTSAITGLIAVATGAFYVISGIGEAVYWVFDKVQPLFWGITGIILGAVVPALWGMATAAWANVAPMLATAGAALAAAWPIGLIGLAIGGLVWWFKHMGVTAEQVFGAIVGAAYWVGQVFQNVWAGLRTAWWSYVELIWTGVVKILEFINKLTGGFDDLLAGANNTLSFVAEKKAAAQADHGDLATAYEKGNKIGQKAGAATKAWVKDKMPGAASKASDFARTDASQFNLDEIVKNTGATAGNTKKLTEGINLNEEDVELLKETARISFVNRFTTMTPNITASFGDVHETADVKGIMGEIQKSVQDALESSLT